MLTTEQKLDALAEYQAQIDYLELKKRELLDQVKIPDEVLKAQDEANKNRQKIDSDMWALQKRLDAEKKEALAAVVDPEMPAEFVKALEAARSKRGEIEAAYSEVATNNNKVAQERKAKIDADLQANVQQVYAEVAQRKNDITAEFAGQAEAAKANIDRLTGEIKDEVKQAGKSVKGACFQAIFVKGRVTWNTDMLDGMVIAFPALEKARKVGEPSVTLRKV